MPQLANASISLTISDDSQHIVLVDNARNLRWQLDFPLGDGTGGQALREQETIVAHYPVDGGEARYRWRLHPDHVEVTLQTDVHRPAGFPLPGAFAPERGMRQLAVPLYQGLLLRPRGIAWDQTSPHGGHNALSMCMAVLFADSGAMLVTHDSPANWKAHLGESTDRGLFFHFQHLPCPVEGIVDATVRLFPLAPALTAACKRYRQLLKQRDQLVTWDEKIARRPMVKNLFGALMAFVGYNKTSEIDYALGARKLRDYGFDTVLYYPLRMSHYSLDFKMGGDDPIWLSDEELAKVHAVEGALIGPWGWTYEALDDGTGQRRAIFRHDAKGPVANWRIDDAQWYQVCTPYQIEHIKQRLAGDMKPMDWIHFDVNACVPAAPCLQNHAQHGGRPMTAREEIPWIHRLFSPETVGNRIVASEGFTDHNAAFYDMGSTKLMPPLTGDPRCIPVPMTMLVFHDCCAHAWWEIHNYNALPGWTDASGAMANSFNISDLPHGLASAGAGEPRLKAAMDALAGSAPHVFPFGKQYGWRNFATRESYSFIIRLEDAAVQEALAAALPVTRLHRKIGRLEMTDHALLSDDGSVQTTLFSDGTRIVANLSREPKDAGRYGTLAAHSWQEVG